MAFAVVALVWRRLALVLPAIPCELIGARS